MSEVTIKRVAVQGLHGQLDVDLDLTPGLNILYGKNGRGKTTILHLLANALELDFGRFAFLKFERLVIVTSRDETLELKQTRAGQHPAVFFNETQLGSHDDLPVFAPDELALLRDALGGRPTYLPAFRSVLERSRNDSGAYRSERRESEIEQISQREFEALREATGLTGERPVDIRFLRNESTAVAHKTVLCRQWFGQFVPIIRYPSIADVDEGLTDEFGRAQFEMSRREVEMVEESFVKIFKVISGVERLDSSSNSERTLEAIYELVSASDSDVSTTSGSRNTFHDLQRVIAKAGGTIAGSNSALLDIYLEMLRARKNERKEAFTKTHDFEESINRFLDNKRLRIGALETRQSRISRSAVFVTSGSNHAYGLSALSSGERQILTMLYSATRSRFLAGTFLIDEPELSLHIDWQRIILRELQAQSGGRQIIACTHSPEVGADHLSDTQDFEPVRTTARQSQLFTEEEDL